MEQSKKLIKPFSWPEILHSTKMNGNVRVVMHKDLVSNLKILIIKFLNQSGIGNARTKERKDGQHLDSIIHISGSNSDTDSHDIVVMPSLRLFNIRGTLHVVRIYNVKNDGDYYMWNLVDVECDNFVELCQKNIIDSEIRGRTEDALSLMLPKMMLMISAPNVKSLSKRSDDIRFILVLRTFHQLEESEDRMRTHYPCLLQNGDASLYFSHNCLIIAWSAFSILDIEPVLLDDKYIIAVLRNSINSRMLHIN